MQKHLVDLVKSFPTNIYLQNLASIQKRTSPIKFAHLAEKSRNCSISNLSTEDRARAELCLDTLCRAVGPAHHSTEVPPAQRIYSIFGSRGTEISIEIIPELAAAVS